MFKLVYHMAFKQTVAGLYDEVATFLNIFQTAAILEVSQVITGIQKFHKSDVH